jgi:hypothetical protein
MPRASTLLGHLPLPWKTAFHFAPAAERITSSQRSFPGVAPLSNCSMTSPPWFPIRPWPSYPTEGLTCDNKSGSGMPEFDFRVLDSMDSRSTVSSTGLGEILCIPMTDAIEGFVCLGPTLPRQDSWLPQEPAA